MSMSLHMTIYTSDRGYSLSNYMIGILIILLIVSWIRTRSFSYVTCAAIFGIYLLFVIDKTFFPLHITGGFADTMKAVPFTSGINLIPFNFRYASSELELYYLIRELSLNIALLVPFGFGISFLAPVRSKHVWWLAPAIGMSIEVIQLAISLIIGYPYRVIDITDVILNTLGFLAGYGSFWLFAWLYRAVTHRFHIKHVGLSAYVYSVANRATYPENAGYNPLDEGVKWMP